MCHHYPGQRAKAQEEKYNRQIGFSQLKIEWWNDLPLEPVEAWPAQEVGILRIDADDNWILENRSWGLLNSGWTPKSKGETAASFMRSKVNARSETIANVWPWKFAFHQRCLLIAGGFYEPHKDGGEALFSLPNHELFFIPGLWDTYHGDDGTGQVIEVHSCVMLTTAANPLVESHRTGRMRQPVIITDVDAATRYCSPEVRELGQLAELFQPWPADQMTCNRSRPRLLF